MRTSYARPLIKTRTAADDNIAEKKKEERVPVQHLTSSSASAKCPQQQNGSVFQPEWQTLFHHVTSGLLTCQDSPCLLTAQFFFCGFQLGSPTPPLKIWEGAEKEKKRKQRVRENWRWSAGALHSTILPSTLAPLQQLSARFHSDATQTRLIVVFVISPSEGKTSSLTLTPTPLLLQNWDWTLLFSHSRASCPPPPAPVLTNLCS